MMASGTGKQKRAVYFTKSTGYTANGDTVWIRVPSPWNAGKSRNKYKR